jgi:hypothetical protein
VYLIGHGFDCGDGDGDGQMSGGGGAFCGCHRVMGTGTGRGELQCTFDSGGATASKYGAPGEGTIKDRATVEDDGFIWSEHSSLPPGW